MTRHMDLKHNDVIKPEQTVCLAEMCPVFGCSYILKTANDKSKYRKEGAKKFSNIEPCTKSDVDIRRSQCEKLLQR